MFIYASFRRGSTSSAQTSCSSTVQSTAAAMDAEMALAVTAFALVVRNRGVESGVLATSCRGAMRRWQQQRWGLAVQLLQAAVGVCVQGAFVVTVDAWPRLVGRPLGPRGRKLPADEAWYWVAPRLPPQVVALAFA